MIDERLVDVAGIELGNLPASGVELSVFKAPENSRATGAIRIVTPGVERRAGSSGSTRAERAAKRAPPISAAIAAYNSGRSGKARGGVLWRTNKSSRSLLLL